MKQIKIVDENSINFNTSTLTTDCILAQKIISNNCELMESNIYCNNI